MLRRVIVSARNLRKDPEAQARLRPRLYWALYLACVGSWNLNILRHAKDLAWAIIFDGFIFGSGYIAFRLIRRAHKKQDEILRHSLSCRGAPVPPAPNIVAEYLVTRLGILASLLTRGWSELYSQSHPIKEGMEATTRRAQNQLLRERQLWSKLEPEELSLVSSPDGSWSSEQTNRIAEWCEQMRLLRWVLKIDSFLLPLSHCPKTDFSEAAKLSKVDTSARPAEPLLPSDIRPARDLAHGYVWSTALEMQRRQIHFAGDNLEEPEREIRVGLLKKSGEFVVDGRYISELKYSELRHLFDIGLTRYRYCQYLIDQIGEETTIPYSTWLLSANVDQARDEAASPMP